MLGRLDRSACRVALVVAPGGYGKSSQVALWAERATRPVAWIDLDAGDNDPDRLLDRLGRALAMVTEIGLDTPLGAGGSRHQHATVDAPALGQMVRQCESPFVLVLDDVHLIDDEASLDLIDAVVRNVSAPSTIVLIGRAMPPLSLARVRVQDGVVDVTSAELSLDAEDCRDVVAAMGVALDDGAVADVMTATGGWPLGVRLAGSRLADGHGSDGADDAPGADLARTVGAYVHDEWLRGLSPDDAVFLLRVSGLGWVCGALCDHVLGAADSGARLLRLHSNGLVVTPVDRRGESFRVHQVARDALDAAFQRSDRAGHRTVQARASEWFERTGDIDRAVHHALRADDLARVERLAIDFGPLYDTNGRGQSVMRWLDAIPRACVLASPGLCLTAAVSSLSIGDGEAAASWSRFCEHALSQDHAHRNDELRLQSLTFRAMLDVDDVDVSLAAVERACDGLPPGLWRGVALTTRGVLSFELGDDDTAIELLSEGAADLHVVGAPTIEAVCRAHLAIVLGQRSQWSAACEVARAARQLVRENDLEHLPTIALVTAASALAEAMSGNPRTARTETLLTRGHLAILHSVGNWHHLQARIALAHACLLLGDTVGARTLLDEAEALLLHRPAAVRPKEQIAGLDAQLRSAHEVLPCGPSSLTSAELRVLHYLPTNLTHDAIAQRLYVSRHTAKSHAAAIYRKLGATSRSQAVQLARSAGLLPADPER